MHSPLASGKLPPHCATTPASSAFTQELPGPAAQPASVSQVFVQTPQTQDSEAQSALT